MNELKRPVKRVCTCCGCTIMSTYPDKQAKADYEKEFGAKWSKKDTGVVCDDCYDKLEAWLKSIKAKKLAN